MWAWIKDGLPNVLFKWIKFKLMVTHKNRGSNFKSYVNAVNMEVLGAPKKRDNISYCMGAGGSYDFLSRKFVV